MNATYGPLVGGPGGVHLLASPGPLTVELWRTVIEATPEAGRLQVWLTTPDRRVVATGSIPGGTESDAPGTSPSNPIRLETTVTAPGPYFLAVFAPGDRYGRRFAWAVRTDCDRYLLECARGHEDRPHTEPIRVLDDDPTTVCFRPVNRSFDVTVEGIPEDGTAPTVVTADGDTIAHLASDGGTAHASIPAGTRTATPWRLRLPDGRGTVDVDGLTRWQEGDPYQNLCLWASDPDRWFPYLPYRWLLRPRRHTAYGRPGDQRRHTLAIHTGPDASPIELELAGCGSDWTPTIETDSIDPATRSNIDIGYDVPPVGEERTLRVMARAATDPPFETHATLTVRGGSPPARTAVPLPIVLEPYRHENAQFGDAPDYPTDWELYVDPSNRPMTRTDDGLAVLRDGRWTHTAFPDAVTPASPGVPTGPFPTTRSNTKIGVDADGDIYLVGTCETGAVLLHSADAGTTFTGTDLGTTGAFDLDTTTGTTGPPGLVRAVQTTDDPDHKWRRLADLEYIPVTKRDGRPVIGQPVRLTDRALGVGAHSGLPNAIVSRAGRTHVIWGEATDPDTDVPGVPTYVASYDHDREDLLGEPTLVGYGPPANDTHNRPSLVVDGDGYLHALTGTHGAPFRYARSIAPNDATDGFTEATTVAESRGTYIGFVCDDADVLHLIYRLWRTDEPPHPGATHAVLAYQRKEPGRSWSAPRPLVTAALPDYSIFYHRLTIDRRDRLLCSYDYWSTYWGYRNDHPEKQGHHRTTIISEDGGDSWRFLRTADLLD